MFNLHWLSHLFHASLCTPRIEIRIAGSNSFIPVLSENGGLLEDKRKEMVIQTVVGIELPVENQHSEFCTPQISHVLWFQPFISHLGLLVSMVYKVVDLQ